MKKTITSLVAAGLMSLAVSAVAVQSYTIDSEHTYPSFRAPHMGISWWNGKFNSTKGKVTLDQANSTGSVEIVIDAASVDFGHERMNQHIKKEDFFNVEKFPEITYNGKLKYDGLMPVAVEGELTLLGKTRPVNLTIITFKCITHPMLKREVCGAEVEGEFNRRDFGMSYAARDEAAGMARLTIQVEALKDD